MRLISFIKFVSTVALGTLLSSCALDRPHLSTSSLYDLGPVRSTTTKQPVVNINVAEVATAAWLDGAAMYYRLLYANDQQPRAFSQNRWAMPPSQLLELRLKSRITQAGGIAATAADGATNLSLLRVEADDFSQAFESATKSAGVVTLRASVFNGRVLIAQKTFNAKAAAPSNDAAGGAKALAAATDTAIDDMLVWLAGLPLKR